MIITTLLSGWQENRIPPDEAYHHSATRYVNPFTSALYTDNSTYRIPRRLRACADNRLEKNVLEGVLSIYHRATPHGHYKLREGQKIKAPVLPLPNPFRKRGGGGGAFILGLCG